MKTWSLLPILFLSISLFGQNAYYNALNLAKNATFYQSRITNLQNQVAGAKVTLTAEEKQVLDAFDAFLQNQFSASVKAEYLNLDSLDALLSRSMATVNYSQVEYSIDPTTQTGYLFYQGKEYPIYNLATNQVNIDPSLPFQLFDKDEEPISVSNATNFKYLLVQNNDVYDLKTGQLIAVFNETTRKALLTTTGATFTDFNTVIGYGEKVISRGVGSTVSGAASMANPASFTTQLVDATAQFLVDRTQEELLLAFIDNFRQKLNDSPEFTQLFTKTTQLLNSNNIFHVPTMGPVWRAAFQEDLQSIVPSFKTLIEVDSSYAKYKNNAAFKLFLTTYDVMQMNSEGESVMEIIKALDKDIVTAGSTNIVDESIRLLNILAANLTNHNGTGFISRDSLRSLTASDASFFAGLIFQQNKPFFYSLKVGNTSAGNLMKMDYKPLLNLASNFADLNNQFQSAYKMYQVHLEDKDRTDYSSDYAQFAKLITSLVDLGFQARYFNDKSAYLNSQYYSIYRPMSANLIAAYQAGYAQNYGQLVLNSMLAFEPIMKIKVASLDSNMAKLMVEKRSFAGPRLTEANAKLKKMESQRNWLSNFSQNFLFYGSFMVDVLAANNAVDMKGILEKYATPVGSYIVKRDGIFSLDINAYPGLYGGYEQPEDSDEYGFVTGVTAPIGLSLNWGNRFLFAKAEGFSTGLFVPLIDIGAAFSYRWNDQSEGFPQEITLKQIFSPGAYVVFGMKNLPLAINVGAQYTPELRTIGTNGVAQSAIRYGVNVAVDISIFNLYNKTQKN